MDSRIIAVFIMAFLPILSGRMILNQPINWDHVEDPTSIKWAHAVNNRDDLEKYLKGDVDFLEADVSSGIIFGDEGSGPYPVMAHSSLDPTDISLEEWVRYFRDHNLKNKGMKLDFKSTSIMERSMQILNNLIQPPVSYPIWINANILPGAGGQDHPVVDAKTFIEAAKSLNFNVTFSTGWEVSLATSMNADNYGYTWEVVYSMYKTASELGILFQPLTFPVYAIFCNEKSVPPLHWLLQVASNSTLTVWSNSVTNLNVVKNIQMLVQKIPKTKLYIDIPSVFADNLKLNISTHLEINSTLYPPDQSQNIWIKNQTLPPLVIVENSQKVNFHVPSNSASDLETITGEITFLGSNTSGFTILGYGVNKTTVFKVILSYGEVHLFGDRVNVTESINLTSSYKFVLKFKDSNVHFELTAVRKAQFGEFQSFHGISSVSLTIPLDSQNLNELISFKNSSPLVIENLQITVRNHRSPNNHNKAVNAKAVVFMVVSSLVVLYYFDAYF